MICFTLIHITYSLIFGALNILPLCYYNIFSAVLYCGLQFFLLKRKYLPTILIALSEIFVHVSLATILLGWVYGFTLQILTLVSIVFYLPFNKKGTPYLLSFCSIFVFFALRIYTFNVHKFPYEEFSVSALPLIYILNCIFSITPMVLLAITYHITTINSQEKLSKKNKDLLALANTDPLTGLLNRRSMISKLDSAYKNRALKNTDFSIIISDIDDFKNVNDTYGHECGDEVLKKLSNIFNSCVSENDYVCRWGGEEILILINNCSESVATNTAETIRRTVEKTLFKYNDNVIKITITLGISCINDTIQKMLLDADNNLYKGKKSGKNCCVINNEIILNNITA